jgi:hypothetical protein
MSRPPITIDEADPQKGGLTMRKTLIALTALAAGAAFAIPAQASRSF